MKRVRQIDEASRFSSQVQLRCAAPSTAPVEDPPCLPLASDRFRLLRRLGQGATSVVYRAVDYEMRREVALKSLSARRPDDLHRLKREFRLLASLDHPNLVRVHELFVEGCHAFFTMDLLFGSDARTFVSRETIGGLPGCDYRRLRGVACELASALAAVHAAGYLHGDVKPSNILVTPAGRVVLFDISTETEGEASGPSDDWYSFGVTLFEAATGHLPCNESARLTKYLPDAPADLDDLIAGLLSSASSRRPSEADILEVLGASRPDLPSRDRSAATRRPRPLLDHPEEGGIFVQAVNSVRRGRSVTLRLHGSARVGKSELAHRFVDEVESQGAFALRGRCRSQETIAFNALDEVVDDLSDALEHVPRSTLRPLLSPHSAAIVDLFPVLGRIEAILEGRFVDIREDHTQTVERARGALRALLVGLANARPLVMWIDDAHLGDRDSGELLRYLLEAGGPPILLVLSYRSDEGREGGTIEALSDVDIPQFSLDVQLGQTTFEVPGDSGRLSTVLPPPIESNT